MKKHLRYTCRMISFFYQMLKIRFILIWLSHLKMQTFQCHCHTDTRYSWRRTWCFILEIYKNRNEGPLWGLHVPLFPGENPFAPWSFVGLFFRLIVKRIDREDFTWSLFPVFLFTLCHVNLFPGYIPHLTILPRTPKRPPEINNPGLDRSSGVLGLWPPIKTKVIATPGNSVIWIHGRIRSDL